MLELYLIRHGQTEWNLSKKMQGSKDSPLTAQGEQVALDLGAKLKDTKFDKIYASSIKRAATTAGLIFPGQEIEQTPLLRELAMGKWEGMTYAEIESAYPTGWEAFFNNPFEFEPTADGEVFADMEQRLVDFLAETDLLSQTNQRIAIVSHRLTLRMLLSILFQERRIFSNIDLDPASLSVIEVNQGVCTLKYLNNEAVTDNDILFTPSV